MPESEIQERKRRATLFKKARELSTLCIAEVAIIAFTSDGKLHECSTNSRGSVEDTLTRYNNFKGGRVLPTKMESSDPPEESRRGETAVNEEDPKSNVDQVLEALKGQHEALELEKMKRTGKALDGLSREELYALEQQQKWALVSVLKKKEELLVRALQRSMAREQKAIKEKEILIRRGSEEGMKEIPFLQLFPENSSGFNSAQADRSKAVSVLNCPTQDMNTSCFRLGL